MNETGIKQKKAIRIPKMLQELFGFEITKTELLLILLSCLVLSALLLAAAYDEWRSLELWRQVLLIVLTLDICGGVIANFSHSTNSYYAGNAKARLVFILLHVQPLLIAFLLDGSFMLSLAVTVYTMAAGLIANSLAGHRLQRMAGALLMVLGLTVFLVTLSYATSGAPLLLKALLSFHLFKVVYAFAVDHYAERNYNLV